MAKIVSREVREHLDKQIKASQEVSRKAEAWANKIDAAVRAKLGK